MKKTQYSFVLRSNLMTEEVKWLDADCYVTVSIGRDEDLGKMLIVKGGQQKLSRINRHCTSSILRVYDIGLPVAHAQTPITYNILNSTTLLLRLPEWLWKKPDMQEVIKPVEHRLAPLPDYIPPAKKPPLPGMLGNPIPASLNRPVNAVSTTPVPGKKTFREMAQEVVGSKPFSMANNKLKD